MIASSRGTSRRRIAAGVGLALVLVVLIPAMALAHPLGNFTINHYAGLRIEPDRVLLDVVVDQAEIPTFQARLAFETGGFSGVTQKYTYSRLYNLYLDPKEQHSYLTRKLVYNEAFIGGIRDHLMSYREHPPKNIV